MLTAWRHRQEVGELTPPGQHRPAPSNESQGSLGDSAGTHRTQLWGSWALLPISGSGGNSSWLWLPSVLHRTSWFLLPRLANTTFFNGFSVTPCECAICFPQGPWLAQSTCTTHQPLPNALKGQSASFPGDLQGLPCLCLPPCSAGLAVQTQGPYSQFLGHLISSPPGTFSPKLLPQTATTKLNASGSFSASGFQLPFHLLKESPARYPPPMCDAAPGCRS